MKGKRLGNEKINILAGIEINFVKALQQKGLHGSYVLYFRRDVINVAGYRILACKAQLHSYVCPMANTRFCELSVKQYPDSNDFCNRIFFFNESNKTLRSAPGTECMRTGRTYTYFKDIEYGDSLVWQECFCGKCKD